MSDRKDGGRVKAVERIIGETRSRWEGMTPGARSHAIERICSAGGMTVTEALVRIEGLPCPQCGSTDLDRGATGLDVCNNCGKLSREGEDL